MKGEKLLLLSSGADPGLKNKNDQTALHLACKRHHDTCALRLLEKMDKESIDIQDKDLQSSLHIAARNGLSRVVSGLIKKGADVLLCDKNGIWPVINCAGSSDVAESLKHLLLAMLPQGPELVNSLKTMMASSKNKDVLHDDDDLEDDGDDDDDD